MADDEHFPLFPLGLVALPHEAIPLHIFEDRYKEMIGFCLENDVEFGIIWAAEDGTHDVGCAVVVETVLDRMPDGRIDILCRGTRPFGLIAQGSGYPYPTGEVVFLADDEPVAAEEDCRTREIYAELLFEATEREIEDLELNAMTSYEMAATVEFGSEAKQTLLELREESARLSLLEKIFLAALERVNQVGRTEALARSNGKVRFGD
ncbi:MAG: LON peptidase substrate-binding domain-containing protein [Actinomycetes bacterium]